MDLFYIFDIDGTIADATHRLHFIQGPKKDWDAFYDACDKDLEIDHVVAIVKAIKESRLPVWMVTGRSERVRQKTSQWLIDRFIPFDRLLMRTEGNYQPDHIVKPKLVEDTGASLQDIIGVFEDRTSMVDEWRRLGVPCYQVAPGDF